MIKPNITFEQFLEIESKLSITVGEITKAERVPKSKKLLRLEVLFDGEQPETRIVVTNIGDKFQQPSLLEGSNFNFIMNLEPVTIMGIESTAMILPHTIARTGSIAWPSTMSGDVLM